MCPTNMGGSLSSQLNMGRRRNSNRRNNGGKGKTNDSRGFVAPGVRPINKRGRKNEYDTISLNRAEQHISTIVNSGLFQIEADDGSMVVVSGLEARRMGFSTDCFTRISARGIEGSGFLPMKLQPSFVVWRIEQLIEYSAVKVSDDGRLQVDALGDVKIPNEEEKELHWDPRKKGRNGRMGSPRGRVSKMNKLGLNGTQPGKSRNQGHNGVGVHDSKGWISKKEAERNGGVAASTGRRVKSSGHFAHTQRAKAAAAATIRMERKIQQVNAESKEAVVDAKGLNKKLQADQEKRAKAEAQRAARVEVDTDDLAIDAMFAPAQKKE